jgi:hypothetical protein
MGVADHAKLATPFGKPQGVPTGLKLGFATGSRQV